jgi:hypothetical protein
MSSLLIDGLAGIHAVTTLMLTGLIWMVQLVHYPLFRLVGADAFCDYEAAHTRRITWLVGPLMLLEAASALVLMLMLQSSVARVIDGVGLVLLVVIGLSTAVLQVPCHSRLSRGFDETALRRLISTNWIRTAAWSARGIISILLLRQVP